MSVYKDNATGKWRVIYRYTDITGKRKQTQKRGFETKREAVAWEHEMMLKAQAKLDMTFGSFYEIYEADKASRLKQSTWETKSHIIRTKILPYFADRKIDEIEVRDVIAWQNELLAAFKNEGKEERYSQDYLSAAYSNICTCDEILQSSEESVLTGRNHWKGGTKGDAILDERRVSKICRGNDGQAAFLL